MKISDEILMRFADDELDAARRAEVEAAMRDDPNIATRIEEHRALRSRLQRAFAKELEESPPDRLVAAARGLSGHTEPNVVSLDAARVAAARSQPLARAEVPTASRPAWRPAASLAASLLVGIGIGAVVFHQSNPFAVKQSGGLVANGVLAKALSSQPGNAVDPSGIVRIGLSFVAKSGDYCRTFTLMTAQAPAGLACRPRSDWQIQAWSESTGTTGPGGESENYRTAGSALPAELAGAVEERIAGDPLDRAGEAAALSQGWRAPRPKSPSE